MFDLSRKEARRLMIGAQLLAGKPPRRPTKQLMRDTIRHLGAVQIDTIHVVARSHHIVLWSRLGNHPQDWLYELLGQDRAIFEYWAHAAAFAPIELYPFFRRKMLAYRGPDSAWSARTRQWIAENRAVMDQVVEHCTKYGPVSSSTFAPPEGAGRAESWAWYGNKPTNVALELLWSDGTLMIDRREKFQRWYDLTERVHPTWDDSLLPSVEEERNTLAAAALTAMGVATDKWLPDYFRKNFNDGPVRNKGANDVLNHLVETGFATPVRIEGIPDNAYVQTSLLDRKIPMSRTTLLSPFDSLVWHRRRALELFDFELMLEAYTPAPKRQYGYFSLPILYRDQLVGRLDPKAERKTGQFFVKSFHLEPAFIGKDDDRFYASLAATLRDFAAFNGCHEIEVHESIPRHIALRLTDALHPNAGNVEAAGE